MPSTGRGGFCDPGTCPVPSPPAWHSWAGPAQAAGAAGAAGDAGAAGAAGAALPAVAVGTLQVTMAQGVDQSCAHTGNSPFVK